ncbi:MAG: shikimate dehydrogenase [Acetobacteraceae bacterium]|nr:shikimate dehydrogenase [Acetobacteraceae bacterium]
MTTPPPTITGTTRVIPIIGQPIRQVRSPDLFNALAARRGADAVLVPIEVAPADVPGFVAFHRTWRNSPGFVVTVPHKRAVAGLADALSPRAARLGAVNLVVRDAEGRLAGDHLDGMGFLAAARAAGFDPAGRGALVVGLGGAGSAIVDALCEAGLARLALRDLDAARLDWMRDLVRAAFPAAALLPDGADLSGHDLVVNATPVGMGGTGGLPVPATELATLRPGAHVADVVTHPAETPFLAAARARGCTVQTGPAMTAAQMEEFGRRLGLFG